MRLKTSHRRVLGCLLNGGFLYSRDGRDFKLISGSAPIIEVSVNDEVGNELLGWSMLTTKPAPGTKGKWFMHKPTVCEKDLKRFAHRQARMTVEEARKQFGQNGIDATRE